MAASWHRVNLAAVTLRPARTLLRRRDRSCDHEVAWDVGRAPVSVVARRDERVRLTFRRNTGDWASDAVCFPDFGMVVSLAPHAATPVDLDPPDAGAYRFYAPHGDLEGWLIVGT